MEQPKRRAEIIIKARLVLGCCMCVNYIVFIRVFKLLLRICLVATETIQRCNEQVTRTYICGSSKCTMIAGGYMMY